MNIIFFIFVLTAAAFIGFFEFFTYTLYIKACRSKNLFTIIKKGFFIRKK